MAWCALWIWMGVQVGQDIRGLIHLSDTVSRVGTAVDETGRAIESFDGVPLVGDRLTEPGREIAEAGRSAVLSARKSRTSVRRTGTLLGLSIALIPTLPAVLFYVPQRLSALRTRRRLERLVSSGLDPKLEACLALRAVTHLPLDEVGREAWDELRRGEHRRLADLELSRLGVRRVRR